jgi:hypothetical protein
LNCQSTLTVAEFRFGDFVVDAGILASLVGEQEDMSSPSLRGGMSPLEDDDSEGVSLFIRQANDDLIFESHDRSSVKSCGRYRPDLPNNSVATAH